MLQSPLVKTEGRPTGKISMTTFRKYRQWWILNPSLRDGLCHHCMERRRLIQYVHREFPETNPEIECEDYKENEG